MRLNVHAISSKWIGVPDPPATVFMKDGVFNLQRGTEGAWGMDLPIDGTREFEIEFIARLQNKAFMGEASLQWAYGCEVEGATALYFHKGSLYITSYGLGEWQKRHHIYKRVPAKDWYKYSIRKVGGDYYVFVDDIYAFSYPYTKMYGQRVAFKADKVNLMVDKIQISYLN